MLNELEVELSAPRTWGFANYPPGATFGPRLLTDYEFVWMTEGDAQYRWGAQDVDAPQGTVLLGRPGVTDFFQWDARRPTQTASAACVTPEHLCRLFRVHVGCSPMETLALARLDRALALLTRANYSVSEVAELCGYANPFHFSRRFAKGYGVSPTAARQAARAGGPVPRPLLSYINPG